MSQAHTEQTVKQRKRIFNLNFTDMKRSMNIDIYAIANDNSYVVSYYLNIK